MSEVDIVYANPQDSLVLLEKYEYIPLVHSNNLYDEIVFIANKDADSNSLSVFDGSECLSCNSMMVTRIGIKALFEKGIKPKKIFSKDNWMAVVKAVSQGEKPYGFVYKDFYDGLNKLSKSLVTKIGETNEKSIFHSVFVKKEFTQRGMEITDKLLKAHKKVKGNAALKAINIERFVPVTKKEVLSFKSLLDLKSEIME